MIHWLGLLTPDENIARPSVIGAGAGPHGGKKLAAGADTTFAAGSPPGSRTLFLPWSGYRGNTGPECRTLSADRPHRCLAIATAWHRCSPTARKLHARNVSILAADTDALVDAVACWTRDGLPSGGTGMGIRIAHDRGIPVLNLGVLHPRAACERLEGIRVAASPGTRRP